MASEKSYSLKRLWLFLLLIVAVSLIFLIVKPENVNFSNFGFTIGARRMKQLPRSYCYQANTSAIIFLHVTNKSDEWHFIPMCSIRAAALLNNDTGVCVLTKSPMKPHPALADLQNLEFALLNLSDIFDDTPLEPWYHDYVLNDSRVSHLLTWELSDASRLAYLYKYGGKYMDTDSWTLKNLASLRNVAGWYEGGIVNGVLVFEKGHPFLKAALDMFPSQFHAGVWGTVGPPLINAVHAKKLVDNSTYSLMPDRAFYPIRWTDFSLIFDPNKTDEVFKIINGSYTVHLYGYMIQNNLPKMMSPPEGSFAAEFLHSNCSIN